MNMHYILETNRLRLREFTLADAAFILELLNSPGWLQFIGDRDVKTKQQALSYLEKGPFKSYLENGYGLYLAERKDDQKAIGMCGILKREHLESPDIGFAFLPDFTGQGYGFEIAAATLLYAKEKLGIPKMVAITLIKNTRSIRLLEKIGLKFSRTICFPDSTEELLLYSN